MNDSIIPHLTNLRKLFTEAAPTDPRVISDYAWTIVKALLHHCEEIDSITARQLLADSLQLTIERPSRLYSALLSAAVKVSGTYPEFRFATFLRMWDIRNLRPEDNMRQQSQDGKAFPSLTERTAKALAHSLLLHPEAPAVSSAASTSVTESSHSLPFLGASGFETFLTQNGFAILPMLVTRIKEAVGKDGRKYHFVTLISPEGHELETISHNLQISPLAQLPEGKRHYVNIGQLYNCVLRKKNSASDVTLHEAFLSNLKSTEIFPTEIGYIEAVDSAHGHMHVYDAHSRHFVAPILRFSREKSGDFVRFIPIIPQHSKFKTAIIVAAIPANFPEAQSVLREIRITTINQEKGYAAWELTDKSHPITELLSPLQRSEGETSPAFTSGYINLPKASDTSAPRTSLSPIPDALAKGLALGQHLRVLVYLKRGKDRQKRPHIARIFL